MGSSLSETSSGSSVRGEDGAVEAVFESLSDHGSDPPDDFGEWQAVVSDSGDVGSRSSISLRPLGGVTVERVGMRGWRATEGAF